MVVHCLQNSGFQLLSYLYTFSQGSAICSHFSKGVIREYIILIVILQWCISSHKVAGSRAAHILRENTPVDAVELFDRACLRECKIHDKMPKVVPDIAGNPDPMAAALLIECRGQTPDALKMRIAEVQDALGSENLKYGANMSSPKTLKDYPFNSDAEVSGFYTMPDTTTCI